MTTHPQEGQKGLLRAESGAHGTHQKRTSAAGQNISTEAPMLVVTTRMGTIIGE